MPIRRQRRAGLLGHRHGQSPSHTYPRRSHDADVPSIWDDTPFRAAWKAVQDEALANLKEATELYLEEFPQHDSPRPLVTTFEVAVAAD
jgi:hypothetical protein